MPDDDLHAESAPARHLDHASVADRPHRCADGHREILPGVPVRPPLSPAAERRGQRVRLHRRHPCGREVRLRLVEPDGTPARTGGHGGVGPPLQLPTRRFEFLLDAVLEYGEFGVALVQTPPGRRGLGLVRGEPCLGAAALLDGVVDDQARLREDALSAHHLVGALREDDLRGERHPAAAAVLGAGDPAQVLAQHPHLPPLPLEQRLGQLGLDPLRLRLLPRRLVPPCCQGGVLVQPHHLRAEGGVVTHPVMSGRALPVTDSGGRPHQGRHERAQQCRNERGAAAL